MIKNRVTVITAQRLQHFEDLVSALNNVGLKTRWYIPEIKADFLLEESFWSEILDTDCIVYRAGLGIAGAKLLWRRAQEAKVCLVNEESIKNKTVFEKTYQVSLVAPLDYVKLPKTIIGDLSYETSVSELGSKLVVKDSRGVRGEKVFLAQSQSEYAEAINKVDQPVVQTYIQNTGDFRVFIIGGEVHAVFKRVPAGGEFRSNISLGASGQKVEDINLENKLKEVGLKLAKLFNLEICGVDLMLSEDDGELYFIEINASPNWQGLDAALNTDTPNLIAEFVKVELAKDR